MKPKRIEVLAIGDELLDGRVADTNTLRLARALREIGLEIQQRSTVVDSIEAIVRTAKEIIARGTDLCVVSGGLGPTGDDLTSEAFAALCSVPLERDPEWIAYLEKRFSERGYTLTDNQRKQADRPAGAERVFNPVGTAPGFALTHAGCRFVSVPGVPVEFDRMVQDGVLAPLSAGSAPLPRAELRSFGLIEGEVDKRLASLVDEIAGLQIGYRAAFPEIHVSLRAPTPALLDAALQQTRVRLGDHVFTEEEKNLPEVVLAALRARGLTLATAESCTGGLLSDALTDVPGSSDVFRGGVVVYHDQTKTDLLGVPAALLAEHGAVSEATVRAMAAGAAERLGASVAVAVSGIAGPSGGTPDKPVGTLWMAVVAPGAEKAVRLYLPFDRRRNKTIGAYAAIDLVRRVVRTE